MTTMQASSYFFPSIISSAAAASSLVVQHPAAAAGGFESPTPSAPPPQVPQPPRCSTPLLQSLSVSQLSTSTGGDTVTTSVGRPGRNSAQVGGDFYTLRRSVAANDCCGGGSGGGGISGSGLAPPTSLHAAISCLAAAGTTTMTAYVGLESPFDGGGRGGTGSTMTAALRHASVVTTTCFSHTPLQSASSHLMAAGGLAGAVTGTSAAAAGLPYLGTTTTMTLTAAVDSGALCSFAGRPPDTLQPVIYRRPFTGAKPPYSYISLITMAIQVKSGH